MSVIAFKGKMVLLRGIGPPTPSLPMTCSTTELQQRIHFFGMQNSAPKNKNEAGKCHSYNPMASPDCKCLDNQIKNCGLAGISAQLRNKAAMNVPLQDR